MHYTVRGQANEACVNRSNDCNQANIHLWSCSRGEATYGHLSNGRATQTLAVLIRETHTASFVAMANKLSKFPNKANAHQMWNRTLRSLASYIFEHTFGLLLLIHTSIHSIPIKQKFTIIIKCIARYILYLYP